ncbi:MAG: putative sulfate exporter family transporter [Candidatus Eisenbacteria bacterium]
MKRLIEAAPGVALAALLATAAFLLARLPFVKDTLHVSALLLVILLGMAWRSMLPVPAAALPGIRTAQRPILRWAVAGLGLKLSLGEILRIGGPALAVVVISTIATLGFGIWVARRLGMGEKSSILLAVGSSICGASAVVAADSVVQGEKQDSAIALGVITLLGTIGIVIYPLLGRSLGMDDFLYGLWDGASLHEMAQVVAAGAGFSKRAVEVATVVKLTRICLLAPIVFGLAWSLRRKGATGDAKVSLVPWFLVLFVVFAAINSTALAPKRVLDVLRDIDLWLLCVGMAGVGLQTGFHDLKRAGIAPIAAGVVQWLFIAGLSYALAVALVR